MATMIAVTGNCNRPMTIFTSSASDGLAYFAAKYNDRIQIQNMALFDTDPHCQALLAQYSSASFSSCCRRV